MSNKIKKLALIGDKSKPYLFLLKPVIITVSYWIMPIYLLLLTVYFDFFTAQINEIILQIVASVIIILGLPLSAGFRVDQLSLELGTIFSREVILVVASIVTWINLILIFSFRAWMRRRTESGKKN